ncbi:hypothetical protein ANN_22124 [Periplaneta americana]|uniref:Uncharacterized protein n=1 Tax=Periplaneta americana TaxID=6978 RepID=A0ABQ8S7T3_PERAM|nr:hypothetical protein ANN_22124 [Periplaneta americana]
MAGLCEGGNEPPGSLKAITYCLYCAFNYNIHSYVPRRRWEDNIKMDLREVGYDGRDWINLAQYRDQWRAYVRAAMNLRVP